MSVVGYWPETINCTDCAQRLPVVEDTLASACGASKISCIFGIPHFVNATSYYNTALVVDASGHKVYRQAKLSLAWPFDGLPGRWLDTFTLESAHGNVTAALMICADEFVPEIARMLALKGAQLLFYLSYEGDASKYMYGSDPRYDVAYEAIP